MSLAGCHDGIGGTCPVIFSSWLGRRLAVVQFARPVGMKLKGYSTRVEDGNGSDEVQHLARRKECQKCIQIWNLVPEQADFVFQLALYACVLTTKPNNAVVDTEVLREMRTRCLSLARLYHFGLINWSHTRCQECQYLFAQKRRFEESQEQVLCVM